MTLAKMILPLTLGPEFETLDHLVFGRPRLNEAIGIRFSRSNYLSRICLQYLTPKLCFSLRENGSAEISRATVQTQQTTQILGATGPRNVCSVTCKFRASILGDSWSSLSPSNYVKSSQRALRSVIHNHISRHCPISFQRRATRSSPFLQVIETIYHTTYL